VRFELFVYVDDVVATFDALVAAGVASIKPPEAMPWGETVGFVQDPEGNPVALAQPTV
jgi:lactoylglutathione lyase